MAQIPDSLLNDLRCLKCREFLSCGPITILATGDSLCGRCHIKDANNFRAVAYEAVAAYFLFRCKNWAKHCAYLLNWNDVREHEENCIFGSCCGVFCRNPAALFKPDNKLDLTQEISVFNVPEQILETLTCSLCGYYLSSLPIFVNAEGTTTCHRCYSTKKILPTGFVRHAALEKILIMLMFPCVFRNRGCTKFFRFGSDTTYHEKDCSYGQVQKRIPKRFTDSNGKERGVIETHSGHTYGTITPNSQFFVAQEKVSSSNSFRVEPLKVMPNEAQGIFFKQLMNHRENLVENRWRNSKLNDDVFYQPTDPKSPIEKSPSPLDNITVNSYYSNYVKPSQSSLEDLNPHLVGSPNFNGIITREPNVSRNESYKTDLYTDEGFSSIESSSRRIKNFSPFSETPDSQGSPALIGNRASPIKLNPNELNGFTYLDRFEKIPQQLDGSLDNKTKNNSVTYKGDFGY